MKIDDTLLNIVFNTLSASLTPEIENKKVLDLWTEYASKDGNSNILSYDELDMLLEDNLNKNFIKHVILFFTKNDPAYKNGIRFDTIKHLIKNNVKNEDFLELTIKEALPAWKNGIIYKTERYKWHIEWTESYLKTKDLPEKYLGKDGYELFMSEKEEEFKKRCNI